MNLGVAPVGRRGSAAHVADDLREWLNTAWRAQATVTLFCIIVATSLVLRGTSAFVDELLLHSASTNLNQLARQPVQVLITSAFFVTGPAHLWGFVPFAVLVLAPLERRIGTARWIAGFVAGHVGATLIVAVGLDQAVRAGLVDHGVRHTIDVGWSYGTYALVAVAVFLLAAGWRRWALAAGWVVFLVQLVVLDPEYSNWGHLLAGTIGFAIGPLLTQRYHEQVAEAAPLAIPAAFATET